MHQIRSRRDTPNTLSGQPKSIGQPKSMWVSCNLNEDDGVHSQYNILNISNSFFDTITLNTRGDWYRPYIIYTLFINNLFI